MSRLNKALERIKERESSRNDPLFQPGDAASRAPRLRNVEIVDPISKSLRRVTLDNEVLQRSHLVNDAIDPVVRTSYKMLRTRVLKAMRANGWRSLAVTSAAQGDGKTITAINLAISMAGDVNHNICLVDLDLRHSSVATYLDLEVKHGVSDCLIDNLPLEQAIVKTDIDRLTVLPNVHKVLHSSDLLSSPAMYEIREMLAADPDRIVIYDMPPILAADDLLAFDPCVDAILFVVAEGKTSRTDAVKARELLEGLTFIGTVLNRSDEKTASYY